MTMAALMFNNSKHILRFMHGKVKKFSGDGMTC